MPLATSAWHVVDVGDDRLLVGDLEFGRDQPGGCDRGVGRRVAGAEPVEDGRAAPDRLAEPCRRARLVSPIAQASDGEVDAERARPAGQPQHRLAQLAGRWWPPATRRRVASVSSRIARITAFMSPRTPAAVVGEHRRDAADIGRATGCW